MVAARASWGLIATLMATLPLMGSAHLSKRGHDPNVRLTKPAVSPDMAYLEAGLDKMPSASYTYDKWGAGWISADVKSIILSLNFNPADVVTYNVHYADAADAWVFGHHKQSNITIDSMARQFGQVPLQMRQWVRHVIDVPGTAGSAFETNGNIAFIRPIDTMLTAILHETGHCLDGFGAYPSTPYSTSDDWENNYEQDADVPSVYAQTNIAEDVAEVTVVSVYDQNVPGGYGSAQPNWSKVFHQYATLIAAAKPGGKNGFNLFQQSGKSVTVNARLPPSAPVPISGNSRIRSSPPESGIKSDVKIIDTVHDTVPTKCDLHW